MEIVIGKTAGFCFGVRNAVTKAVEELEKTGKTFCLGELVHNKQVTDDLINKGMVFVDSLDEANGQVIIRSHGVEKQIYNEAEKRGIELVDLTCPKVLHIHNIAEEYVNKGYFIVLIGKKDHPEMIGTVSFCGTNYFVIENETNIENAVQEFNRSGKQNMLVIAQTTYSLEKFNTIVNDLKQKVTAHNLEIKNTICNATKERQEETEKIAKDVDAMIIVGGKHSSNSNKLYELAKKYCDKAYFMETEKELNLDDFKDIKKLGIMAGASTPQESIQKIVEKLGEI